VPSDRRGSEFTAAKIRGWLSRVGMTTLFIEPGSLWENGYIESFNGKLHDELLARDQFDILFEAKALTERWRRHYNTLRSQSSLGYRPPSQRRSSPVRFCYAQQANRAGPNTTLTLT
jgi:transposase InsO family protein